MKKSWVVLLLFCMIFALSTSSWAYETIYSMGSVSVASDETVAAAAYGAEDPWNSYKIKIIDSDNSSRYKIVNLYMTTSDEHLSTYSTELSGEPLDLDVGSSFTIQVIGNQKEDGCMSDLREYFINESPITTELDLDCYILWDTAISYDDDWIPEADQLSSGTGIEFDIELVSPYTNSLSYEIIDLDSEETIESETVCTSCSRTLTIELPELETGNYAINLTASDGEDTINRYREFNVNAKADFDFITPDAANEEPPISGDNYMEFEATVNETIRLEVEASDANDDELRFYWFIDGERKTRDYQSILFTPDEIKNYIVVLNISDGKINTTVMWNITVVEESNDETHSRSTTYSSYITGDGYSTLSYSEEITYDITSIEAFFLAPNTIDYETEISEFSRDSTTIKALKTLDTDTYKYFGIDVSNDDDLPKIYKVLIEFRVRNSWMEQNNIDKEDIVMFRYSNGWNQLKTDYTTDDNVYTYYIAESPGFSYFAIGKYLRIQSTTSAIKTKTIIEEDKEKTTIEEKTDETTSKKLFDISLPTEISEFGVYLLLLIVFLVGAIVLMYLVKRNKPLM